MALPRDFRLSGERVINLLFRKGRAVHTPFFRAQLMLDQQQKFRIMVSVSSNIAPKAVHRNRIRRRICEAVRVSIQEQKELPFLLCALVAKKEAENADFAVLKDAFQKSILRKL